MDVVTLGQARADAKKKRRSITDLGRLHSPIVAGRPFRPTGFANLTGNTFRRVYTLHEDCTKIRLVYTNLCMTAAAEGSQATITIAQAGVWFEGAANILLPVTFGGAATIDILQYQTVVSDPIPVSFNTNNGSVFAVDTYVTHGAGAFLPRDATGYVSVGGIMEGYGAGNLVANNSNFGNLTGRDASFGPTAIVGWGKNGHATTAILGDSIAFGSGYALAAGNSSFLADGLEAAGIGGLNLGLAGEKLTDALTFTKVKNRLALAQGCPNVVSEYGINDLTASVSVATMKTNYLTWWALLAKRFAGVFQTTLSPHTASTDNWRTVSGQSTNTEEANRQTINQWLRAPASAGAGNSAVYDAAGTLAGVFDTAKYVEANADASLVTIDPSTGSISNGVGGRWAVDNTVYFTGTATATGTQSLTDTGKAWATYSTYAGYAMRITADATTPASVGQVRIISAWDKTSIFRLESAWTTTPSVGATYELRKLPSFDGLHPLTFTHQAMAAGVDASRLLRL